MREKIEVAGREPRWEFSKTALFELSAHIGDMCARMLAALDTFHGLRATLGPRLEAMTGNSQVCHCALRSFQHEIKRVEQSSRSILPWGPAWKP